MKTCLELQVVGAGGCHSFAIVYSCQLYIIGKRMRIIARNENNIISNALFPGV